MRIAWGNRKYWKKILSRCYFFHKKFNNFWPGIEPVLPRWYSLGLTVLLSTDITIYTEAEITSVMSPTCVFILVGLPGNNNRQDIWSWTVWKYAWIINMYMTFIFHEEFQNLRHTSGDDLTCCSFLFLYPVKFSAGLLTSARIKKKRVGKFGSRLSCLNSASWERHMRLFQQVQTPGIYLS
jgi:hypothetical protein